MAIVTSPTKSVRATAGWQDSIRRAVRDPVELCRRLDLPSRFETQAADASGDFPVFVPLEFLALMRRGDPADPLLRQVLPLAEETERPAGFAEDPVGDGAAAIGNGLLKKYQGRALLITTGACAVHCRYCFRRHFAYEDVAGRQRQWSAAVQALRDDSTIEELILSGGDPLMIADDSLASLIGQVADGTSVKRLRIHTRLPIMIPSRVTEALIAMLCESHLAPFVVVHANHPRELSNDVVGSLKRLVDAGVPVLNQSVLLKGVNDDEHTLVELSRMLIDARVTPYYLHQLDRVAGAAHFEVPIARGMWLVQQMRRQLPGYAVPRYVAELPGEPSKQVLA